MKRGVAIELQSPAECFSPLMGCKDSFPSPAATSESIGFTARIHCSSATLRNADFLGPTTGQPKCKIYIYIECIFCILVDTCYFSIFTSSIEAVLLGINK